MLQQDINILIHDKQQDTFSLSDLYNIFKDNNELYLKNTLNLFIRQNLLGLIRLYYENTEKSYILNKYKLDVCKDLFVIFKNNIYTLIGFINEINQTTFKKDIDETILDCIHKYIEDTKLDKKLGKLLIITESTSKSGQLHQQRVLVLQRLLILKNKYKNKL